MAETPFAAVRLARFARDHGYLISCVEGIWRAWKPDPADDKSGELAYSRTAAGLLAKLDGGG